RSSALALGLPPWGPVRCSRAPRAALLRCPQTPSARSSALALGLPPWGPVRCSRAPRAALLRCPQTPSARSSALALPLTHQGARPRRALRALQWSSSFEIDLGNATGEAPMGEMKRLLRGAKIDPPPVTPKTSVTELVDRAFLAYNGGRLREAAHLFTRQLLADDVTIGVSL